MSYNVLIVAEDPTLDQHILKPIVEELFRDLGHHARVDVHEPPRGRARGVAQALDGENMAGIIADRPMFQMFVLVVDRDCHPTREASARALAQSHPDKLVVCLAIEEVEVWLLALHRADLGVPWADVRAECHPKERFAVPFLKKKGWAMELGKGRRRAMRELRSQWEGLLQVCPEIGRLRGEVERFLRGRG